MMRHFQRALTPIVATLALTGISVPAAFANSHPAHQSGPAPTVRVHGLRAAASVHLPRTHLPQLAPAASVTSSNWSGHAVTADSGKHLRFVSADFTIPSVNCANSPVGSSGFAYVAHWAGLDGFTDRTVEQTGVDAFCDSTGAPGYFAWYEMYPLAPVAFSGVAPGDAIKVSVYFNGSTYNLVLTDVTTGGFINVTQTCPTGSTCRNNSAEVITEDPGGAVAGGYNLADFGMANYTGATVTSTTGKHGSLAAKTNYWKSSSITMIDPAKAKIAVPGALSGGRAFNVTWRGAS